MKISGLRSNTVDIQKPKKRPSTEDTGMEGSISNLKLWR